MRTQIVETLLRYAMHRSYYFNPVLTCDSSTTNSAITSVSIKDALNSTPAWTVGFRWHRNLNIPTGVSGLYTLSYSWGSNGIACDSCKYYLNITCCDASCKQRNNQAFTIKSSFSPIIAEYGVRLL